ncbi:Nose resistant to fluoxetine protein 6 [Papilio xuthus]|uniref:Nose resistant to fluoxetine protein 6 n=1 Tax=Papilio xuthus TaxID=66420 RepID=A0A194PHK8_PAPXU|nr:Nose resistant to fluoxetine protein 6 [Papilio xuthus]
MGMAYQPIIYLIALCFMLSNAELSMVNQNSAFDLNLYEKVLDPKLCRKQIRYMAANGSVLLAQFLDAGLRVPKGFFDGNADDLGNYYQCLAIDAPFGDSRISGKYCVIQVPLSQDLTLPGFSGKADALNVNKLKLGPAAQLVLEKYYTGVKGYRALSGTHLDDRVAHVTGTLFKLAVCIPRPCTTEVAVTTLLFNLSTIGFDYQEQFCRLPNDKPWVSADSAAVLVFFYSYINWMISFDGLWVSSTPITVDTFIAITGMLLVFTTAKKMDAGSLLRNLHIFYLNRLLRMFPLLATAVLLDASVFHRVGDGPYWMAVASNAQKCRDYWWTTLLHLQNYLNPTDMCVPHSWYIAVDVQLHILSPLVLYWILRGRRQTAWSALFLSLTLTLIVSAIYNGCFIVTLQFTVQGLWVVSLCIISGTLYMLYRVKQLDWRYRAADAALNTLMRPLWAAAVGWMVLACAHGYGGPINWFLSLPLWRLPGRLTYGMYLFHYPIIVVVNGLSKSNNEKKKLDEIEAFEIESRKDED